MNGSLCTYPTEYQYQSETSKLKNLKDLLVSWGMPENKAKAVAINAYFPDLQVSQKDFSSSSSEA